MSRVSRLLNKTVEIWRATQVDDGYGGWTETWSLAGTVRARISQPNAYGGNRSSYRADQEATEISQVVYFEPGTDVVLNDQIRFGATVLDVAAHYEPSEVGTYLRVDCTTHQETP